MGWLLEVSPGHRGGGTTASSLVVTSTLFAADTPSGAPVGIPTKAPTETPSGSFSGAPAGASVTLTTGRKGGKSVLLSYGWLHKGSSGGRGKLVLQAVIIVKNRETVLIKIDIQITFTREFEDLMPLLLNVITHGKGQNSFKTVVEYNMILWKDLAHANN